MRILKNKIDVASSKIDFRASNLDLSATPNLGALRTKKVVVKLDGQPDRRKRKRKLKTPIRRKTLATKNVLKNYGRAIANFAASELVKPYLETLDEFKTVKFEEFSQYALSMRDYIQNIDTFRDCFVIREEDSEKEVGYKKLFQRAGVVFVKYFSVNWIFSGKIEYKMEYIKYRGKVLRRILNPESFVALKPNQ